MNRCLVQGFRDLVIGVISFAAFDPIAYPQSHASHGSAGPIFAIVALLGAITALVRAFKGKKDDQ